MATKESKEIRQKSVKKPLASAVQTNASAKKIGKKQVAVTTKIHAAEKLPQERRR